MTHSTGSDGCGGCAIVVFFVAFAAWLTHVVTCFQTGAWGFLIGGALFFPVAIVHGVLIWLGVA